MQVDAVPEQAPPQPLKAEPAAGVSVMVTVEPAGKDVAQFEQLTPFAVTDPEPVVLTEKP